MSQEKLSGSMIEMVDFNQFKTESPVIKTPIISYCMNCSHSYYVIDELDFCSLDCKTSFHMRKKFQKKYKHKYYSYAIPIPKKINNHL
jgi:hypothetical protein